MGVRNANLLALRSTDTSVDLLLQLAEDVTLHDWPALFLDFGDVGKLHLFMGGIQRLRITLHF